MIGAGGETRTRTMLPLPDFESGASTNFATPAGEESRIIDNFLEKEKQKSTLLHRIN